MHFHFLRLLLPAALFTSTLQAAVDFEGEVLPILEAKCFKCHSDRTSKPKAGLRFDSAGAIVEAGKKPGFARVLEVIALPEKDDDHMPPKGKAEPVTESELAVLKQWVAEGVNVGSFIAFDHEATARTVSGLGNSSVTTEVDSAAAKIDELVANVLKEQSQVRTPLAKDAEFLRRVYLELAGRNPNADEANAFLLSSDPDKRARLIDSLLDSEAYVSRHYNYWADLLRAQSDQRGNLDNLWLSYIKDSIRNNVPWDKWVYSLLTAEGRMWEDPAIGFYLRDRNNRLAGYESTISLLLGTDIGCAQCHDHPTEPLNQIDYYSMWGFMIGTHPYGGKHGMFEHLDSKEVIDAVSERNRQNRLNRVAYNSRERDIWLTAYLANSKALEISMTSRAETMMSRVPKTYRYDDVEHGSYLHPEPIFGASPELPKKGVKPAVVFADWLTSPKNLKFTHVIANRMWTKVMGASLLGSLTHTQWPDESHYPALANHLAELMIACEYDLKLFQRILMNTRTFQSAAVSEDQVTPQFAFQGPVLRRLEAEQVWDSLMTLLLPEVDQVRDTGEADLDFYFELRSAKSIEQYWEIITKRVDKHREKTGKPIGYQGSKNRQDARVIAAKGFINEEFYRASELRSPTPPGHFLRVFGQGQREMIDDKWTNPTIPQSLMLLNGALHDHLTDPGSTLSLALKKAVSGDQKLDAIYLSVLSRLPTSDERILALESIQSHDGPQWFDLAWALINTTEFLFQP